MLSLSLFCTARAADTPSDAIENLENAGKLLFKMADTNNDNNDLPEGSQRRGQPAGRRLLLPSGCQW